MMPFAAVLRVVKVFPQVQVTSVTRYSGWMSFFMVFLSGRRVPGRASARRERGEPEPRGDCATPCNAGGNPCVPSRWRRENAEQLAGTSGRVGVPSAFSAATGPAARSIVGDVARRRLLDLHEELDVRLALLEPLQQELEGLLPVETREHPAELPDDLELLLAHQQLLAAGAALDGVDRGEQTLVGEVAA